MSIDTALQRIADNEEALRKAWNLEGFTIGVVKDGKVIHTAGYGNRKKGVACDVDTVMPIGSVSKSFTALLIAMLIDEGKLTWDSKIRDFFPELKLWEESTAEQVTIRDCLSHKTGIAQHDMHGVYCMPETREEAVKTFEYLQTGYEFRKGFKYSNQMVVLAGYVAELITGKSWEELVKERITDPLGMTHTTFCIAQLEKEEKASEGYMFNGQENVAQPYLDLKSVGPAGGINSTAGDMAQYMIFHLGDGTWNGKRLVSKEHLEEMHKVQSDGTPYLWTLEEIPEAKYGLCWFVDQYRGRHMVSHGGNTLGFSASLVMVPSEDLGVVVLSNGTTNFLSYAITYDIVDEVLGIENDGSMSPWTPKLNAAIGPVFAGMAQAAQAKEQAKVEGADPSHVAEEYAGTYVHPGYGTMVITEKDGNLTGVLNGYNCMIKPYHYDYFDVAMEVYGMVFPIEFRTGMTGNVTGFEAYVEGAPGVQPVLFTKQN